MARVNGNRVQVKTLFIMDGHGGAQEGRKLDRKLRFIPARL